MSEVHTRTNLEHHVCILQTRTYTLEGKESHFEGLQARSMLELLMREFMHQALASSAAVGRLCTREFDAPPSDTQADW